MVSKETEEIFSEHMIARTIKYDLHKIKTSQEMIEFTRGLKFKSEKTKEVDLNLINLLILKLEQYSEGWIRCNANKTAELWNKSKLLDELHEDVNKSINQFKNLIDHYAK